MRALRRLLYWIRFRENDDVLREELAAHRALLQAENERRGLDPRDALDAARRTMGNETLMREDARGVWLSPRIEALLQDWRYASRGLRRAPVFALVAVVSLGIGIGANTAIFGLIHALLLADVAVPAADELFQPRRDLGTHGFDDRFSYQEVRALDGGPLRLASFASSGASAEVDGVPVPVTLDAVDGNYFDLLRPGMARGRGLSASDDADAAHIVVVTERFWRTRLNADPNALGRSIKIHEQSFTVVGMTSRGFAGVRFPANVDVMMPYHTATTIGIVRDANGRSPMMTVVGRRAAGQSPQQVQRMLAPLWSRCCADGRMFGVPNGQSIARAALAVRDVRQGIPHPKLNLRGDYSRILLAMMAGVGILLLAACANVANLLLARNSARMGELAVRLALGASRTRLVAQLAIESIQLSLVGAAVGLVLARWATIILARAEIGELSAIVPETIETRVLVFTVLVSLACGVVFGVVPALRVMRSDLIAPLKQGGRRASQRHRAWTDRGLVALQMALALLLVSGAALLVETLRNLQRTDLGFDPAQRLIVNVETRRTSYERSGMTAQLVGEMLERVRAIPGVRSAGFGSSVPIQGGRFVSDVVRVPGVDAIPGTDEQTWFIGVTPDYFAALGIAFIAGRDIGPPTTVSSLTASREVVVNAAFAEKYFPGKSAIGRVFNDNDEGDTIVTADRIVGVVANARYTNPRLPADPIYYVPVADGDWPFLTMIVRPVGDASSIASVVSRAVTSVAPGIGRADALLLSVTVRAALARERMSATLAALFGAMALLLVAVGLYGVMLYQVAERTTEIGIRMALGARPESVVGLVLRDSFIVAAAGVVVGLPLALLAGHAVASQLYGVAPYSMGALAVAAACLVAVTLAASLVPVWRAVRIDPLTALRAE